MHRQDSRLKTTFTVEGYRSLATAPLEYRLENGSLALNGKPDLADIVNDFD